jgi:glycosyltransferase involved in cell wall biosynthesis
MLAPFGIRPKGTLAARMLPLAQALVGRGHCVSIVAPPIHNPQDAGRRALHNGVPVTHAAPARLPGGLDWAPAMLLLALRERPDLLHLFKPKGYGGLAALLARALRPGLPLVLDTDDWEGPGGWNDLLPYPAPARALFAWQERDLPRRAAAVTAASRTLEAQVRGFGVPAERVFYMPNGMRRIEQIALRNEKDGTSAASHCCLLLYTRFWEFDVREVVAALVAIVGRRPQARLLVVGKGERGEERQLLELAARAGVAWAIDYRGWVEPEQIPALLAAADVALAPLDDTLINRARGQAKLIELLAAGLPVVAGNVGQAGEYIEHGRSGLLVPPGNPGALAHAAIDLLDDTALRRRLGAAAQARVSEQFSWPKLSLAAERAYRYALMHHS